MMERQECGEGHAIALKWHACPMLASLGDIYKNCLVNIKNGLS